MSNEYETITLDFEDGTIVECEAVELFEVDGRQYMALLPVEEVEEDEEAEVYLLRYIDVNDEEFELEDIETDEEFDKVAAEFDKIVAEEE